MFEVGVSSSVARKGASVEFAVGSVALIDNGWTTTGVSCCWCCSTCETAAGSGSEGWSNVVEFVGDGWEATISGKERQDIASSAGTSDERLSSCCCCCWADLCIVVVAAVALLVAGVIELALFG